MAYKTYNEKELKTTYDASTIKVGTVLNLVPQGVNNVKRTVRDFDRF